VTISLCAGSSKFGPSGIGPLAFSMGTAASDEAAGAAEFAYKDKKWRSVYSFADTKYDFTKTWVDYFATAWKKLAGASSITQDTVQSGDISAAAQVTRLEGKKPAPDAIVICAGDINATLVKAIRDAGINTPIVECVAGDGAFYLKAIPSLTNFYVMNFGSYLGDDGDPKVNELVSRYHKDTGSYPTTSKALLGYATGLAIIRAVESAKSTAGAKVAAALEQFKSEPLAAWPTTYTKTSHIAAQGRSVTVMQVTNGKPHFFTRLIPTWVPPATEG
jgi:branched-chain amino acid transport system substrate-binding protein